MAFMEPFGVVVPGDDAAKPLRCIPDDVCPWGVGLGTHVVVSCPGIGLMRSRPKWQCVRVHPLPSADATVAFERREDEHTTNCIRLENGCIHQFNYQHGSRGRGIAIQPGRGTAMSMHIRTWGVATDAIRLHIYDATI